MSYLLKKIFDIYDYIKKQWHDNNLIYEFSTNGTLRFRFTYKNEKLDGLFECWYVSNEFETNGNRWVRCPYKNGGLNGLYEQWHVSNEFKFIGSYQFILLLNNSKSFSFIKKYHKNSYLW